MYQNLITYNFGDCEIRELAFDYPHAAILIFDPYQNRDIRVDLFDVDEMIFISDHTQNVIGGIYICEQEGLSEFRVRFPRLKYLEDLGRQGNGPEISKLYLFANAVAGGDCFCRMGGFKLSIGESLINRYAARCPPSLRTHVRHVPEQASTKSPV